jgi:hypothetical protein
MLAVVEDRDDVDEDVADAGGVLVRTGKGGVVLDGGGSKTTTSA